MPLTAQNLMPLSDLLLITLLALAVGAGARCWVPRAVPPHYVTAMALALWGAWIAVGLVLLLSTRVPAGATAAACALLGAWMALDAYHLTWRRRPGRRRRSAASLQRASVVDIRVAARRRRLDAVPGDGAIPSADPVAVHRPGRARGNMRA
jgi:hypothetical protein